MNGIEAARSFRRRRYAAAWSYAAMCFSALVFLAAMGIRQFVPMSESVSLVLQAVAAGGVIIGVTGMFFMVFFDCPVMGGLPDLLYPILISCPSCDKHVPTQQSLGWSCAKCDETNYGSILFPCGTCTHRASGFVCPRCAAVIPFREAPLDRFPARFVAEAPALPTAADVESARIATKQQILHEIELEKLLTDRARVVTARRHVEEEQLRRGSAKGKSPRAALEEDHAVQRDHALALEEVLVQLRGDAKSRYRDDPEGLNRYLHWLESAWKERAVRLLENL